MIALMCSAVQRPVSVESRLLEWRRRAKSHAPKEEQTVYAPLRHSSSKSKEDDDTSDEPIDADNSLEEDEGAAISNNEAAVAEENETRFLLA